MSSTKRPPRRQWPYRWLIDWAGITYAIAILLTVAVIGLVSPNSWARAFRILGLTLNATGVIIVLTPRLLRGPEEIERELGMTTGRERLRADTILARWGLTFLVLGFFEQLIGAFLFG